MDLHNKYRPQTIDDIRGHEAEIAVLKGWVRLGQIPHCVLFTGPTGTGKTSLARILAEHAQATEIIEINCADNRGLDLVREEIEPNLEYKPLSNGNRAFILDEVCQLPKQTQQAMLKALEEPPSWAYFFLCTTPAKLEPAFKGRCKIISLKPLPVAVLMHILGKICDAEERAISPQILTGIATQSEGSARKAIGYLEKCLAVADTQQQACLDIEPESTKAIDLVRAVYAGKPWKEVAQKLKECEDLPETVRQIMLAYANTALTNSGHPRASAIIRAFQYSFADSGQAGLTNACWEVCRPRS